MKKHLIKIIAITLVAVMLTAAVTGCKKDPESMFVPPEYVFVADSVTIETDNYIYRMIYTGGKLYFASTEDNYSDGYTPGTMYRMTPVLYSMNSNGTGLAKLPLYTPYETIPDGWNGSVVINSLNADSDGNLWVVERWDSYRYNVPADFDWETDAPWEYPMDMENGSVIRKLSPEGMELSVLDISSLKGDQEYFYIETFGTDAFGNIYLGAYNYMSERGGYIIYVLDTGGKLQFTVETDRWMESFIQLSDGSLAVPINKIDENDNYSPALQKIDLETKALGQIYDLPARAYQTMPGSGEYDLLYQDSGALYGFSLSTPDAEPVKLLNWLESDVLEGSIGSITMLSDDVIICTNQTWDNVSGQPSYELLTLTKTPYADLPQRQVITLAAFGSWSVRDSVVRFNRTNSEYRIHVIDYQQYSTEDDWMAGRNRLSTEIISGVVPDILDISNLPYKEYVAKGLLADLYPLIDSDPEINRSDLVEGAFRAAEINGKLYQVFASFYINTIIGNPRVLGSEPGWNMDEFVAVLEQNPQADMPLGQWLTKMSFLQSAVSYNIDDYIDWVKGTTNFDNNDFIRLLEFSNTFPDEYSYYDDGDYRYGGVSAVRESVSQEEAIATGRQIMQQITISDYWDLMWNRNMFGGEIVFKGFPTEDKRGNSLIVNSGLAIMEKSPNKEAAWQFVREILDKDNQLATTWGSMVTNKAAFDQRAASAMEQEYQFPSITYRSDGSAEYNWDNWETTRLSQADINTIINLIDSASGTSGWNVEESIWNIITEEVSDYFAGNCTAQDAARIIQSRVSLLVSERS